MKNKYAKLFINTNNNELVNKIYSLEEDDYYKIVRQGYEKGYKQIIITSRMMTSILKDYFCNRDFTIVGIEFMVDDSSLNLEINNILNNIKKDRVYFGELINRISFLSDESAIDIKKIELKGKNTDNQSVLILIQVNGVYRITDKCFEDESQILLRTIEGCLK